MAATSGWTIFCSRDDCQPEKPVAMPSEDVLYGIGQCERILSDTNATSLQRAAFLPLLIHFVGNMHQPLHYCSLVNDTYPNGDKGGNDFYVKPASWGIERHSLWDGVLGRMVRKCI
jgi:hypothetical protein